MIYSLLAIFLACDPPFALRIDRLHLRIQHGAEEPRCLDINAPVNDEPLGALHHSATD